MVKIIQRQQKLITQIFIGLFLFLIPLVINIEMTHAQTSSNFTFGAAGDFANGTNFHSTVTQIKAKNPNFQLALGDLAYSTVEQTWCNYWKANGVPNIEVISGNHDSGENSSGNINTYVQYCPFTLGVTVTGTYGKQYYFDYPATNPIARFIMITPSLGGSFVGMDTNYALGSQGYNWTSNAIDDARSRGIKWVVVGMHKNCLTMATKSCNDVHNLEPITELFVTKKVDLVLQAHDHSYQRSKQITFNGSTCTTSNFAPNTYNSNCVVNDGLSGNYSKGAGTIFNILGTGGQGLYTINTGDSERQYFTSYMGSNTDSQGHTSSTYGFSYFTVTPTQLSAQFVRSAGNTFSDSFTISTVGIPTPPPSPSPTPTSTPISTPTSTPTPTPSSCPITLPTGTGQLTTNINLTSAGNYRVWSRIKPTSDTTNSFYLQVDSNCPVVVGDLPGMPTNQWTWVDYQDGNTSNKIDISLSSGTHTLKMVNKEISIDIDRIVTALDKTCVPVGTGDNCLAFTPTPPPTPQVTPTATPSVTPTATPSTPTTQTFYPTADAWVDSANTSANNGTDNDLQIDASPAINTSYIKFDLSSLAGKTITNAKLRLWITNSSNSSINIKNVSSSSWGETSINYTNKPALGSVLTTFVGGSANLWKEITLTSAIAPKAGTIFTLGMDQLGADGLFVSSREATNKPQLVITYQ